MSENEEKSTQHRIYLTTTELNFIKDEMKRLNLPNLTPYFHHILAKIMEDAKNE